MPARPDGPEGPAPYQRDAETTLGALVLPAARPVRAVRLTDDVLRGGSRRVCHYAVSSHALARRDDSPCTRGALALDGARRLDQRRARRSAPRRAGEPDANARTLPRGRWDSRPRLPRGASRQLARSGRARAALEHPIALRVQFLLAHGAACGPRARRFGAARRRARTGAAPRILELPPRRHQPVRGVLA